MPSVSTKIEKVIIDRSVADEPLTRNVLGNLDRDIAREYIHNPDLYLNDFMSRTFLEDPVGEGKKHLLITRNKGCFFKSCPGTPNYLCCLYKILNFATGCPMDCSYCILQGYFTNPLLTLYANSDDMFEELSRVFEKWRRPALRIGTGEFTDSLALDELTEFNRFVLPFLKRWKHVYFEVKSKQTCVASLEEFAHDPHIICSWSLSPQRIIDNEERETASLRERLNAAQRCQEWGFGLGFHFDPIIRYQGWEEEYHELVRLLFKTIDKQRIYWISLGTLRFPPQLKEIIHKRFPASKIVYEEFVIGGDGKARYFMPIRLQIYKRMYQWIREYAPDVAVYFCMENPCVWRDVMGYAPRNNAEVAKLLDESCLAHSR